MTQLLDKPGTARKADGPTPPSAPHAARRCCTGSPSTHWASRPHCSSYCRSSSSS
ncbi:hypothetical protein NKH18_17065 [Streptomyces sp. M10(2022)]